MLMSEGKFVEGGGYDHGSAFVWVRRRSLMGRVDSMESIEGKKTKVNNSEEVLYFWMDKYRSIVEGLIYPE